MLERWANVNRFLFKAAIVLGIGAIILTKANQKFIDPKSYESVSVKTVQTNSYNKKALAVEGKILYIKSNVADSNNQQNYLNCVLVDGVDSVLCQATPIPSSTSFGSKDNVSLESLIDVISPLELAMKDNSSVIAKGVMNEGVLRTYEFDINDKKYVFLSPTVQVNSNQDLDFNTYYPAIRMVLK
jgi:hypothetical protein